MTPTDSLEALIGPLLALIRPNLWWILPLVALRIVFIFPMPGRGPRWSRRDPWRGFRFEARAEVFARAGDHCEGATFFVWGRCSKIAMEVDHVFPHSKGGPTVVRNGQALCHGHNSRKGNRTPPWWYILGLEKRRLTYFPENVDVHVRAKMTPGDVAARERWAIKRQLG